PLGDRSGGEAGRVRRAPRDARASPPCCPEARRALPRGAAGRGLGRCPRADPPGRGARHGGSPAEAGGGGTTPWSAGQLGGASQPVVGRLRMMRRKRVARTGLVVGAAGTGLVAATTAAAWHWLARRPLPQQKG